MKPRYLALVALLALLLSACSSAAEPTATQVPTSAQPTATDRPATATSPSAAVTEPPPSPTATRESLTVTDTPVAPPATDTPQPADPFAFLQVGPDEWVRGPADAPVTIIEYADFQ
jgi:PBP1b-binding outer membrane lipoprotein LpoB